MEDLELGTLIWKIQSSAPLHGRFRAQYLPYMEGAGLSIFFVWKIQSSAPLYGRFRAQYLPYMEGAGLSTFLIWMALGLVSSLHAMKGSELYDFHTIEFGGLIIQCVRILCAYHS